MNEDTCDLIRQLCMRAGMIMEDASLLAITMHPQDKGTATDALARLERDAQGIARLIAAAGELARTVTERSG